MVPIISADLKPERSIQPQIRILLKGIKSGKTNKLINCNNSIMTLHCAVMPLGTTSEILLTL